MSKKYDDDENYYDIERKRTYADIADVLRDIDLCREAEYLSQFETDARIDLGPRTEQRQLCPGLFQPKEKTYYDLMLNLFPEGLAPLKQLELLAKHLHDLTEEGSEFRIRCDLSQDVVRSKDHLAAYLQLATQFPDVILMLESEDPDDFLEILPAGQWYPSNVYVGTVIRNPEEWESRLPVLDRVPSSYRYLRLPNPVGMLSLRNWAQSEDWGAGVNWLIVELDPASDLSEDTLRCVALLHSQAKLWDISLYLEGGKILPKSSEENSRGIPYDRGPDGLQFPSPFWMRDSLNPDECAPNLTGCVCDILKCEPLDTPIRDIYRVICHAEGKYARPIYRPQDGGVV